MIVGIDPGEKGGLAFLGETIEVQGLPYLNKRVNVLMLSKLLEGAAMVVIESVSSPRTGGGVQIAGSAGLTIGTNYGRILATVELLGIPLHEVPPATWKRSLGLLSKDKETPKQRKERSIALASQWFPGVDLVGGKRTPQDGLAEALLIAEYGRRNLQ